MTHLILLTLGLAGITMASDRFIERSARLARRLGVSEFVVGVTLASIGTSFPELAASVSGAISGYTSLVVGNLTGSNIANIGLILGVAAIVRPVSTAPRFYDRDGYVMLASVLAFFAFSLDNQVSRPEAAMLLAAYVLYVLFVIRSEHQERAPHFRDFLDYVFGFRYVERRSRRPGSPKVEPAADGPSDSAATPGSTTPILVDAVAALALAGLIVASAVVLVREAVWLAAALGLPENVVGLSVVAVGTSLPELSVAVAAARQGRGELVVGSVLGSNIANLLLIGGVSSLLRPLAVAEQSVVYSIPIMLFFSLALLYFVRSDWRVGRGQGLAALASYAVFMTLAVLLRWS